LDGFFRQANDNLTRLFGVMRPVNHAACTGAALLELSQIRIEVRHRVLAYALAGEAQLFPIREFRDNAGPFVLNDRRCVMNVLAELLVAQQVVRGFGKRRSSAWIEKRAAHRVLSSSPARISAMCMVRTGEPRRCRPP